MVTTPLVHANTSLAAGAFYVYGPHGDVDPKHALESVVFSNAGTTPLRLGHSLTGILAGRYIEVDDGTSIPLDGPLDNLIVYNAEAATAGSYSLSARCCKRNSGQDAGVLAATDLPASNPTRYTVVRPSKVAGAITDTAIGVGYQRTWTSIKAYSVTIASGATITVDFLDHMGRSLLAAVMDAEALTNKTLYTATTLSTTVPLTVPARAHTIRYSSSAGGDTLNDILIELAHVVA